jgi:hypothetical protein
VVGDVAGTWLNIRLLPGSWAVVVVCDGFAPAVLDLHVLRQGTVESRRVALEEAATLLVRPRRLHDSGILHSWKAYLEPAGVLSDGGTLAGFFKARPIASNGTNLTYRMLPAGAWRLRLESPGLATVRLPMPAVEAHAVVDLGHVFLPKLGSLRVELRCGSCAEARLATITVYDAGDGPNPRGRSLLTKQQVFFRTRADLEFPSLTPGPIFVHILQRDRAIGLGPLQVLIHGGMQAIARIVLAPRRITGTVSGKGAPSGQALVRVAESDAATVTTDAEGRYELTVWTPGRYRLRLAPARGGVWLVDAVNVEPEDSELKHDVELPSARLYGRVLNDETNQPIAGAMVAISGTSDNGESFQTALVKTGNEGMYSFEGLMFGTFTLIATSAGHADARVGVELREEEASVDIRCMRAASLRGAVSDSAGGPISSAVVSLVTTGERPLLVAEGLSTESGEFQLGPVPPGRYVLVVFKCRHLLGTEPVTLSSPMAAAPTVCLEKRRNRLTIRFSGGEPWLSRMPDLDVGGGVLPYSLVRRLAGSCGEPPPREACITDFLPFGQLRAVGPSGTILGAFRHDGSQVEWTLGGDDPR